jgi:hypothetical protein
MKISKRLGFVAHRRLGVPLVLPNGDHYKSREDADDGKFETRHFIVEAEAIGASLPAAGGNAVDLGSGDDSERPPPKAKTSFKNRSIFIARSALRLRR